jgi:hypothetical protein
MQPSVIAVAGSEIAVGIVGLTNVVDVVLDRRRPGPHLTLDIDRFKWSPCVGIHVAFTGMRAHGEVLAVLEADIAWQHGLKSKAMAFLFSG